MCQITVLKLWLRYLNILIINMNIKSVCCRLHTSWKVPVHMTCTLILCEQSLLISNKSAKQYKLEEKWGFQARTLHLDVQTPLKRTRATTVLSKPTLYMLLVYTTYSKSSLKCPIKPCIPNLRTLRFAFKMLIVWKRPLA